MRGIVSLGLSVQNLVSTKAKFTICNIALFHPNPMAVIRGGYWRSSEADKFPPDSIPRTYFTHLFYATVAIDPKTYKIHLSDIDKTWMERFTSVISQNSDVKCFLSIGEDTEASRTVFSKMVSTSESRKSFIDDSIKVAREKGFHGLDLYWKYPATENELDMPNLGLLLKEWHQSLINDPFASKNSELLLGTTAYFAPKIFPSIDTKAYPFEAIKDNVDFLISCAMITMEARTLMPLLNMLCSMTSPAKRALTGITSWINDTQVPKGKLVMGMPFYGKSWTLKDPNKSWIGAPATGVGPNKDYSDILKFNNDHHANVVDDGKTVSTYSYAGQYWIGYDSKFSIEGKVQYAKDHALGGYFFWALGMDRDYDLPRQAKKTWS